MYKVYITYLLYNINTMYLRHYITYIYNERIGHKNVKKRKLLYLNDIYGLMIQFRSEKL